MNDRNEPSMADLIGGLLTVGAIIALILFFPV